MAKGTAKLTAPKEDQEAAQSEGQARGQTDGQRAGKEGMEKAKNWPWGCQRGGQREGRIDK